MTTTPVLYQPTTPEALSEEQWAGLERTANRLANVSWLPEAYRRKPAEIMAAGLALATIGVDLTPMSLKLVYVVKGTVDFMVDLIVAQVHAHGHEIWVVEVDETHATVAGQRRGSDRVHEATFTIEDARKANLVGKDVWKQYVKDMLVARAAKRVAKRICPEALLSMPPPLHYAVTDTGRVQLASIVHEDPDDEPVDAELVDPETGEVQAAPAQIPGGGAGASSVASAPPGPSSSEGVARPGETPAEPPVPTPSGDVDPDEWAEFVRWKQAQAEPADVPEAVDAAPAAPLPRMATGGVDWRHVCKQHGITQGDLLRQAQEFARGRDVAVPETLAEITDEQVIEDLREWVG
jgi:hypothetical protein